MLNLYAIRPATPPPMRMANPKAGAKPRRKRVRFEQLDLWSGASANNRAADLVPTRPLLRHRSCGRVLEQIRHVRFFFPELDGVSLRVGLTRTAAGFASKEEPVIWVNPRRLTRHTIAHELVHLLQTRGLVPGGEKSADLFALARHAILADDVPSYLEVPRSLRQACATSPHLCHALMHCLAREAVARREGGHRTYLRWFEDELKVRWNELRASGRLAPRAPQPSPQLEVL